MEEIQRRQRVQIGVKDEPQSVPAPRVCTQGFVLKFIRLAINLRCPSSKEAINLAAVAAGALRFAPRCCATLRSCAAYVKEPSVPRIGPLVAVSHRSSSL